MNAVEKKNEIALRDWSHLVPADVAHKPPENAYSYEAALWATGVKVLGYETFGSYQGDWWAKVEFPNHQVGFIHDYYGSCSGCDAFEAEFGWKDDESPAYLHRLKDFGRGYLSDINTFDQAIEKASENLKWDHDAQAMVDWLTKIGPSA